MWDAEESARRGFASPQLWKQQISSREYERLKAISRKWFTGDGRRDWGLVKAAFFIASAMAKIDSDFDMRKLLPNVPPEREGTPHDHLAAFEQISRQLNSLCPQHR